MNDLISRKEAIELLRKNMSKDIQDQIITENNINLIESLPTAFDTEKVVEQLEEIKDNACDGISCEECKYTRWCNEGEKAENVAIDKAIDIVKKGGVE